MLVKDLINQLSYMNPEAEVHYSYNYGDHWRTQVAPTVASVEEGAIEFSHYHSMYKLADQDFEDEEPGNPDENVRRVVVIS
jgi:hypothetical protein